MYAQVAADSPVGESSPITVTLPLADGQMVIGVPTGASWDCSASTSTVVQCTSTATGTLAPGANLPPISFVAVSPNTGELTSGVSVVSPDATTPVFSTATVDVLPPPTLVALPQLVLFPFGGICAGNLRAVLTTRAGTPLVGRRVGLYVGGISEIGGILGCGATTDSTGAASCSISPLAELIAIVVNEYTAFFSGDEDFACPAPCPPGPPSAPSISSTPVISLFAAEAASNRTGYHATAIERATLTRGDTVYASVTRRAEHGKPYTLRQYRTITRGRYTLTIVPVDRSLKAMRRTVELPPSKH